MTPENPARAIEDVFPVLAGSPRVCMGTGVMGSAISLDSSFAALDAYFAYGGRFFDTAHIYAAWLENGEGASERTLGAWVRERGVRDSVVIGTKGAHPPLDNMEQGRCGPDDIGSDMADSLRRLGMDAVDLYWLHRDDPRMPVGEIVVTMGRLVREGKARAWGVSNWTPERIEAAARFAASEGLAPPVASQPGWSLASWPPDSPLLGGMLYVDSACEAFHRETGFPLVAYSSQATGWFGEDNVRWARAGFAGAPPAGASYDCPANRDRLLRAAALGEDLGRTATQVALAWLLHQPFPVYPVIGTTRPGRIREAVEAKDISLSPEQVRYLRDG
jgi:aryl-alcohol dehydrogenase-like predicted oxidoreductase